MMTIILNNTGVKTTVSEPGVEITLKPALNDANAPGTVVNAAIAFGVAMSHKWAVLKLTEVVQLQPTAGNCSRAGAEGAEPAHACSGIL